LLLVACCCNEKMLYELQPDFVTRYRLSNGRDSWGGQNVFDVYTKSQGEGRDGTKYKDWRECGQANDSLRFMETRRQKTLTCDWTLAV
jgi:hypothetical protein